MGKDRGGGEGLNATSRWDEGRCYLASRAPSAQQEATAGTRDLGDASSTSGKLTSHAQTWRRHGGVADEAQYTGAPLWGNNVQM